MHIKALACDGYKNLDKVYIEPHPEYNVITGMNAQGKTNLLESIWLMTGCRSFRGSKDKDYIGIDKQFMQIEMKFNDGRRDQSVKYAMSKENLKNKNVTLNGVSLKGTNKLFDSFKAVVFTPDDIEIIKGTPEKRRTFMDLCLCQLSPGGLDIVKKYDLLLNHRNSLLKSDTPKDQIYDLISVWDKQIAVTGTILSIKRNDYIKKLSESCKKLYSMITGGKEELSIEYSSNVYGANPQITLEKDEAYSIYFNKLQKNIEDEIRLGYTLSGSHRDDILIKINGLNVKEFGSQGQKKTVSLVMKLGQAEIYYKNKMEAPVILLDDVMGELDENRQRLVFDIIKNMQVFITTCNENSLAGLADGSVFSVESGKVIKQR